MPGSGSTLSLQDPDADDDDVVSLDSLDLHDHEYQGPSGLDIHDLTVDDIHDMSD